MSSSRRLQIVDVIILKVSGGASLLGTGYVMQDVVFQRRRTVGPYRRILCGMAAVEFLSSLGLFLGSWCVPRDFSWWGASGNLQTCNFQGFLIQLDVASTLYTAGLALYYLLLLRYQWREARFVHRLERWIHVLAWLVGLGTAVAGIPLGLYSPVGSICYRNATPHGCQQSWLHGGKTTCIRGDNASLYQIIFSQIWKFPTMLFLVISLALGYQTIHSQESRNDAYVFRGSCTTATAAGEQQGKNSSSSGSDDEEEVQPSEDNAGPDGRSPSSAPAAATWQASSLVVRSSTAVKRQYSRQFAIQGALYILAYFMAHSFATVSVLMINFNHLPPVWLRIIGTILLPLEGFLNFLTYLRPRFLRYRRLVSSETSSLKVIWWTLLARKPPLTTGWISQQQERPSEPRNGQMRSSSATSTSQ